MFLHRPDEKFYDFSKIREEIVAETNRVIGTKQVSFKFLEIRSYIIRTFLPSQSISRSFPRKF